MDKLVSVFTELANMYNTVTANCNKNAETLNRNIQLTEKRYAAMMKLMQAKKSKTIEQPPIPQTIKALPRFIFMTTPTHSSFSVSGNSLEYLIGIYPEIMVYGYYRGINESGKFPAFSASKCLQNSSIIQNNSPPTRRFDMVYIFYCTFSSYLSLK